MLGRQAAVLGRELSWDEMLKHPEKYSLNMDVTQFN
jgi:hypothetical protein